MPPYQPSTQTSTQTSTRTSTQTSVQPAVFDQTTRRHLLAAAAATAGTWALALPRAALAQTEAFDQRHSAWAALLKKHVVVLDGGHASQLRYAGMAADRAALKAYLAQLSAVPAAMLESWPKPQQMAFLINAYNAFTVELILGKYPKLASIKDLGNLLQSPWKQSFVPLLGGTLSLDQIEHENLRTPGRFNDPRIHFAVNCASVGCPMLREEAFVADRLDAQLDEQSLRFLSDRSRNRYADGKLQVSKIFDWYGADFKQGHRGITSLPVFLARYATQLADAPADRSRIQAGTVPVAFLDYDWALNAAK